MAEVMRVARPYARAVFDLAQIEDQGENWSELLLWLECVVQDAQAVNFFLNPTIDAAIKVEFILAVNAAKLSNEGKNLVLLLAQSNRLLLIPQIRHLYEQYRAAADGVLEVELSSAKPLSVAESKNIMETLSIKRGKKINLSVSVDPSLLGGMVIKTGDEVIDASIKGQLRALREQLLGAKKHGE